MTNTPVPDQPPQPLAGLDPQAIRAAFTGRDIFAWEDATGVSFEEFSATKLTFMLAWWAARHEGVEMSLDDALSMNIGDAAAWATKAVERLGKVTTGAPTPAEPSEQNVSQISRPSPFSTTSPSRPFSPSQGQN